MSLDTGLDMSVIYGRDIHLMSLRLDLELFGEEEGIERCLVYDLGMVFFGMRAMMFVVGSGQSSFDTVALLPLLLKPVWMSPFSSSTSLPWISLVGVSFAKSP